MALLLICLAGAGVAAAPAQADYQGSRSWFARLSLEDQVGIQLQLMFTGDYVGLADGLHGRRTYQALVRFQRRNGMTPTGRLSRDQLAFLEQQAGEFGRSVGFRLVDDPRAGVTIGMPSALLPESAPSRRGTQWSSADGRVELETVRVPASDLAYLDLYARLRTEKPGREITYSAVNDSFFVVSGRNRGKHFYSRFQRTPEGARCFSVAWHPDYDSAFARISIAMSSMLFPLDPTAEAGREADRQPEMRDPGSEGGQRDSEPGTSGTGFFVSSAGAIATNAHVVEECGSLEVPSYGRARLIRADAVNDLAVVQVATETAVKPVRFRRNPLRLGEDVVVLGYPLGPLMANSLTVTSGQVASLAGLVGDSRAIQISAPVQPGNSGGPLFDRTGAVVGIVSGRLNDLVTYEITGTIPQNVNFAIRSSLLVSFLEAQGLEVSYAAPESETKSVAEIAELGRASTVQVVCND